METPEPAPLTDAERADWREFFSMCLEEGYVGEEQKEKAERHLAQSLTDDEFCQRMDADPDLEVVRMLRPLTNEDYGLPLDKWHGIKETWNPPSWKEMVALAIAVEESGLPPDKWHGITWEPWNLPSWTGMAAWAVAALGLAVGSVAMYTSGGNPLVDAIGMGSVLIFLASVPVAKVFEYGRPVLPDRLPAPSRWTVVSLLGVRAGFPVGFVAGLVAVLVAGLAMVPLILLPLAGIAHLFGGPDRLPWLGAVAVWTLMLIPAGVVAARIAMSLRFRKVRRALDDGAETSLITRT